MTLAVICTAAALMLLFALVNQVGPVRATTITDLNNAVAVVAGPIVLDETVPVSDRDRLRARHQRVLHGQPPAC